MANFRKHLTTGATIVGSIALINNILKQNQRIAAGHQTAFDGMELLGKVLLAAVIGGVGGVLPDILEPAYNPHHRKTYHSVTLAIILCRGMLALEKSGLPADNRAGLQYAGMGYLSHLLLDLDTPMGLPFI